MEIIKITENNLDFVEAICLDPNVDQQKKALMENGILERNKSKNWKLYT